MVINDSNNVGLRFIDSSSVEAQLLMILLLIEHNHVSHNVLVCDFIY
jgi:hypothetical protein